MTTEELRKSLLAERKNGYTKLTAEQRAEMESYCKGYMSFIDACKTEREATTWTVEVCKQHGFKELVPGMSLQPGDKVYYNNRGKSLLLAVIGTTLLYTYGFDNALTSTVSSLINGFSVFAVLVYMVDKNRFLNWVKMRRYIWKEKRLQLIDKGEVQNEA